MQLWRLKIFNKKTSHCCAYAYAGAASVWYHFVWGGYVRWSCTGKADITKGMSDCSRTFLPYLPEWKHYWAGLHDDCCDRKLFFLYMGLNEKSNSYLKEKREYVSCTQRGVECWGDPEYLRSVWFCSPSLFVEWYLLNMWMSRALSDVTHLRTGEALADQVNL